MLRKQFGGPITESLRKRYASSSNWHDGRFQNLETTEMNIPVRVLPKLLYKQFFETNERAPSDPIPVISFDADHFLSPAPHAKFIWYGHSTLVIRVSDKTILIDPMFGASASPVNWFARRFTEPVLDIIDQLPPIDLVLLSHDHYDHLDLASIQKLKNKAKQYVVALGVERHLTEWGISEDSITTFDWWDRRVFDTIEITFTPSRHFSGRGILDRFLSLWGGWVLKTGNEVIYFSGDSGYGSHFKTIGDRLGPFNIGFMECGQYDENWHQIHMFPEEAIQAAIDAQVQIAVPVHWSAFPLAQHSWKDPVERFVNEGNKKHLTLGTPAVGQMFSIGDRVRLRWWDEYK